MKYFFVIFLILVGFIGSAYATEPKPVGISVLEYGIFDQDENIVHELKVDQKYQIKIHFESELDAPVSFSYTIQIIDKNKHWTETVKEFRVDGFLQPDEQRHISFEWTPKHAGQFRTLVGFADDKDSTSIGAVPQYDFEVISNPIIEENTEPLTISEKTSDNQRTNGGRISNDDTIYPVPWEDRPPLKQLKDGVNYNEIHCRNDDQVLVLKQGRTFPACVNPETVQKLFQRNWALNETPVVDTDIEQQESRQIKAMGVINRFDTFEVIEYQFIPLRKELPKISHSGYNAVNLFATDDTIHQFIRNLDGSLVEIHGSFLFEDGKYLRYLSGFPIIPVEKLEVISENELLDYSVDGAELISITKIPDDNALNIVLEDTQGGTLEISIPRKLIDAKTVEKIDDVFIVLIDGFEVTYTEIVDENTRALTISFDEGDRV